MHLQLAGFDQEQVFRPIYSEQPKQTQFIVQSQKQPMRVPSKPPPASNRNTDIQNERFMKKQAPTTREIEKDGKIVLLHAIGCIHPIFQDFSRWRILIST